MENSSRAEKRNKIVFIVMGVVIALLVVFLVLASCNNSASTDTSPVVPSPTPTTALPPCDPALPKRQQVDCTAGGGGTGYGYQPIPQPTMPSFTLPGFGGDATIPEPAKPTFWSNPLGGIWGLIKSIFGWVIVVAIAFTVLEIWHPLKIKPWTFIGSLSKTAKEKKTVKKEKRDKDDEPMP